MMPSLSGSGGAATTGDFKGGGGSTKGGGNSRTYNFGAGSGGAGMGLILGGLGILAAVALGALWIFNRGRGA